MTIRSSIFDRLDNSAPVPHPDSWPARQPPHPRWDSPAHLAAYEAVRIQAGRTYRAILKARARAYALRPRELDAILPELSSLSPQRLVTCLLKWERLLHGWRHFGFGGEIPAINLRGAMLYSRFARAKANQLSNRRKANADG